MHFFKNNYKLIIGIIIGIILTSSVIYAYSYIASDVKYTNEKSVENALDDLYNKSTNYIMPSGTENITSNGSYDVYNKASVNVSVPASNWTINLINDNKSTYLSDASFDLPSASRYKYFKVTSLNKDSNVSSASIKAWSSSQSSWFLLTLNQQYEVLSNTDGYKFSTIGLFSLSKSNNTNSRSNAQILLYN